MGERLTNEIQLKALGKKFLAIKDAVTMQDRKDYIAITNYSKATVSMYLNGKVKDPDRGLYMLLFFKGRIQKRQAQLEKA